MNDPGKIQATFKTHLNSFKYKLLQNSTIDTKQHYQHEIAQFCHKIAQHKMTLLVLKKCIKQPTCESGFRMIMTKIFQEKGYSSFFILDERTTNY